MSEIETFNRNGVPMLRQIFAETGEFIQAESLSTSTAYRWSTEFSLLAALQVASDSGLQLETAATNALRGYLRPQDQSISGEKIVDFVASTSDTYIDYAKISYMQCLVLWHSVRVLQPNFPVNSNTLTISRDTRRLSGQCFSLIEETAGPQVAANLYTFAGAALKHLTPREALDSE